MRERNRKYYEANRDKVIRRKRKYREASKAARDFATAMMAAGEISKAHD